MFCILYLVCEIFVFISIAKFVGYGWAFFGLIFVPIILGSIFNIARQHFKKAYAVEKDDVVGQSKERFILGKRVTEQTYNSYRLAVSKGTMYYIGTFLLVLVPGYFTSLIALLILLSALIFDFSPKRYFKNAKELNYDFTVQNDGDFKAEPTYEFEAKISKPTEALSSFVFSTIGFAIGKYCAKSGSGFSAYFDQSMFEAMKKGNPGSVNSENTTSSSSTQSTNSTTQDAKVFQSSSKPKNKAEQNYVDATIVEEDDDSSKK